MTPTSMQIASNESTVFGAPYNRDYKKSNPISNVILIISLTCFCEPTSINSNYICLVDRHRAKCRFAMKIRFSFFGSFFTILRCHGSCCHFGNLSAAPPASQTYHILCENWVSLAMMRKTNFLHNLRRTLGIMIMIQNDDYSFYSNWIALSWIVTIRIQSIRRVRLRKKYI